MQDLTQKRHGEEHAAVAKRLKDFVGVLAHELRNPIAPIRNAVELMAKRGVQDEALEAMRQTIDRQSRHLIKIVDELADISRVVQGRFAVSKERIDLRDVLRYAVEISKPLIDARRHEMQVDVRDEPPNRFRGSAREHAAAQDSRGRRQRGFRRQPAPLAGDDGSRGPRGLRRPRRARRSGAIRAGRRNAQHQHAGHGTMHEPYALRQGLEQNVIDVVKYNKDVKGLSEKDATFITFGRTLYREHHVSNELWNKMLAVWGKQQTIELMAIVGEYFKVRLHAECRGSARAAAAGAAAAGG